MMSAPSEFKANVLKIVELPSKLTVQIRRLQARDFLGAGELPLPVQAKPGEVQAVEDPLLKAKKVLDAVDVYGTRAIVAAVVNPRFSDRPEDIDNDNVVHISYLSQQDFNFLIVEIINWSGMNREAGQTAEAFRANGIEKRDPRAGDALP